MFKKIAEWLSKPKQGVSLEVAEARRVALEPPITEAQIKFLHCFQSPTAPHNYAPKDWRPFWEDKLAEDPTNTIERLLKMGLLQQARPEHQLKALNLKELRWALRQNQLKVSGKKAELVERVLESGAALDEFIPKSGSLLVLSETGQRLHEEAKSNEAEAKDRLRKDLIQAIKNKNYDEACDRLCSYEVSQFFQRGINIDWRAAEAPLKREVKAIFTANPGLHRKRWGGVSDEVRILAAMSHLTGKEMPKHFVSTIAPGEDWHDLQIQARMLQFAISHRANKKRYKKMEADFEREVVVQILPILDQRTTCSACKSSGRLRYSPSTMPELPHTDCKCEEGCRCTSIARPKKR